MLALRPRSGPEIVDAGVGLLRGRYWNLAALAGVAFLPYAAAEAAFFGQDGAVAGQSGHSLAADLVIWVTSASLAEAALTRSLAEAYHGRGYDPTAVLRGALGRVAAVAVAAAVMWAMIGVGMILLIVPGVLLYARLSVAQTAVVLEDAGPLAALRRSWELTRAARLRVLGVSLVLLTLSVALTWSVSIGVGWVAPDRLPVLERLAGTVASALVMPLTSAVTMVLYYDLRIRSEGYDIALLASAA